jgi:hypothetical protein
VTVCRANGVERAVRRSLLTVFCRSIVLRFSRRSFAAAFFAAVFCRISRLLLTRNGGANGSLV